MGKTADLTAVQKAIIDTLKREGKTQKEISEQIGCSQSAVSRHLSGKSVGRKKCGKKRCTTRRGDRTLRKIVEKDRFQTLGDLRKQWTESGVETYRATVHRRVLLNQKQRQKRLTWATEKQHWTVAQWSKVLFSDESKFCMSFGNQGARVWRKTGEKEMPKCLKSSVKYPQSVMLVLVHCVLSRAGSMQLAIRRFWSTSCFHLLKSFMEMKISFFSTTWHLLTVPKPLVNGLLTTVLLCSIGLPTLLT
uniref:Transposase Tc1-like domain-containing protein n=1 Tax=Cyprinus carpio carpio TaxID=630221 RepID=A0A9J7XJE2_CYPCA